MAKKDNPNLIIHKEWWDFLRWESKETIGEVFCILCSDYFDGDTLNVEQFKKDIKPTLSQRFAIPMIVSARADRDSYIRKCENNSQYASGRKRTQADANNTQQMQAYIKECNITECNDNSFLETSGKKPDEKKELLFNLAISFLQEGYTRPYAAALEAYSYNESQGWIEHKKNGRDIDHSSNKLAYLRNWKCSSVKISPVNGKIFATLCRVGITFVDETTLSLVFDSFTGVIINSNKAFICFSNKKAADIFYGQFAGNQQKVDAAIESLHEFDIMEFNVKIDN